MREIGREREREIKQRRETLLVIFTEQRETEKSIHMKDEAANVSVCRSWRKKSMGDVGHK